MEKTFSQQLSKDEIAAAKEGCKPLTLEYIERLERIARAAKSYKAFTTAFTPDAMRAHQWLTGMLSRIEL